MKNGNNAAGGGRDSAEMLPAVRTLGEHRGAVSARGNALKSAEASPVGFALGAPAMADLFLMAAGA